MYVTPGARQRLLQAERRRFLQDEWPRLRDRLQRLGISAQDLDWEEMQ
jgi:GntR family transcriptional regulator